MTKRTKKTVSVALKLFVRLLVAIILCAILNVSMNVIGTAFFSDVIGYQIFEQAKDGTSSIVEEHYYKEGETPVTAEDLKLKENQMFSAIRKVKDSTQGAVDFVSQILMLIVLGVFPYHILWQFGNRDDTNVRYRGQKPDPWRGVRIGLLAMIPFAVMWLLLIVAKFGIITPNYLQVYRLIAFPFMPYLNWLFGAAQSLTDVALWRIFLLIPTLLFVPAVSGFAYKLGGRQFSISEFITFKKKAEPENDGEI